MRRRAKKLRAGDQIRLRRDHTQWVTVAAVRPLGHPVAGEWQPTGDIEIVYIPPAGRRRSIRRDGNQLVATRRNRKKVF